MGVMGEAERKAAKKKKAAKLESAKKIEIRERRVRVFRDFTRGHAKHEIAKRESVSVTTIKNDLRAVRQDSKFDLDELEPNEVVSDVLAHLDSLIKATWRDYHEQPAKSPHRPKFLALIRNLRKDQYDVLKDVGLVVPPPKEDTAPIVPDARITVLPPNFLENLPVRSQRVLVQALIDGATPTVLPEPEPNPVMLPAKKVGPHEP